MKHARRSVARRIAVVAMLVAVGQAAAPTAPAAADIALISPARLEAEPGGSVATTVTVRASGLTCVNARPSDEALQPSFTDPCDDEPEWRTTMFVAAPDEPGTYTVRVTDDQSGEEGGRTFTLVVRRPPPPTEPTTTVPPPTTTTAPRPTTTSSTTTTTANTTTTTAAPQSTTTVAQTTTTAPLAGDPFVSLAALVNRPIPTEGVFLPLVGDGFRDCLPLTEPCGHPGSSLLLVPARAAELTWLPLADGAVVASPVDVRGIAPLAPVGVAPAEPRSRNYALSVLDLTTPGERLRTLVRGLDERGGLDVVVADQPLLRLSIGDVATAPPATAPSSSSPSSTPFGRPTIRTASSFTEAAPALLMFGAEEQEVVYALRPDNAWGLNLDLVPLLGPSLPFLVRGIEGPPGLFIARPSDLRVPEAGSTDEPSSNDGGGGGGAAPLVLLGGAVVLGIVATAATAILRRRRAG